jgi:membrane protease YdiL (CAAX protease family)
MSNSGLIGIDDNYKTDSLIGLVAGIIFVFMSASTSISIGIPAPIYIQSVSNVVTIFAGLVVVSFLAPVCEEVFMAVILSLFKEYTNIVVAVLIVSIFFAGLHWKVYGASLAGAYIGAFLFRIIASGLMLTTNSIVPSTVMHSIVNAYLYLESQQLLSVGGA